MEPHNPAISIIVPCYNRAAQIPAIVAAVSTQNFENWEMILMDDGSTDDTRDVVQPYLTDKRIRYFYKPNGGVSDARNAGVERSVGKYLLFLDSDDLMREETLAAIWKGVEETRAEILFCSCRMVKDGVEKIKVPADLGKIFRHVTGLFLAGAFCVSKQTFIAAGGYSRNLKFSENYELGIRLCSLPVKTAVVNHVAADYYIYSQKRTSNSIENKLNANLYILETYDTLLRTDNRYLSTIFSQTGYFYAALGKNKTARGYYLKSFLAYPINARNIYRFLTTFI